MSPSLRSKVENCCIDSKAHAAEESLQPPLSFRVAVVDAAVHATQG